MGKEWYYLPVKTPDPDRIAFSRKAASELTELDKEYEKQHASLGPRPDIEQDGSVEYNAWLSRSRQIIREYLSKV